MKVRVLLMAVIDYDEDGEGDPEPICEATSRLAWLEDLIARTGVSGVRLSRTHADDYAMTSDLLVNGWDTIEDGDAPLDRPTPPPAPAPAGETPYRRIQRPEEETTG